MSSISIMNIFGDVSIHRGSKIIKLTPYNQISLKESNEKTPQIQDGDRIITGQRSVIIIHSDAKDKISSHGTQIILCPNSEAKFSIEEWKEEKEDKKIGRAITKTELIRGTFHANTSESIITPTAEFMPGSQQGMVIDIAQDNSTVFGPPMLGSSGKPLEVKCKSTGKVMTFKPKTMQEVIVTRDGFYKKGMVDLDQRFSELSTLPMAFTSIASLGGGYKDSDKMTADMVQNVKTFNPSDIAKNLQTFMTMDPNKMPGITPEQIKQMKEAQKQMAQMEKEQGRSVASMYGEAQTKIEKMRKDPQFMKTMEEAPAKSKEMTQKVESGFQEALDKYEKLPPYPPLHPAFKVG